ncbi:hypothetical protein GCM10007377_12360 [Galliscardovia ingluviei]|uniref:MobA/VirD2-like nuclease domain-containing protein n=1 Tax=Galliscardovia ingluviei TaxID=1769422 RepID=A0A8J3AQ39_9BIFI|nr:relaxase/mobilization nuclease domain-containing protein [Galliscardovia ingluviei]GGI14726.1 hypothetical protein GCM10007377_12360 [Galliscardovia ingluviei]
MAILKLGKKITARKDQNMKSTATTPIYGVIKYVINGEKTNEGTLVSNNYVNDQDAMSLAEGMIFDLKHAPYGIDEKTRWALHLKHSFSPDEQVTPELAHQIGIELAEAITQGDYKYVIATHVDRHHIHNHIVICMAGQLPPHKHMRLHKTAIQQWRNISDDLCKQYGLSVLEPAKSQPDNYAKTFEELYSELKGISRKQALRSMIDEAVITSQSYDEFVDALQERGISVAVRGNNLVYTNLATGMKVRSSKLGYAYTPPAIMSRVQGQILGWVSINETLIKSQSTNTITFYLPKSKRQLLMSVPREQLIQSNKTYHIFFAEDAQIVLKDRRGRYVKTINKQDLYQYFGDKTLTAIQQIAHSNRGNRQHVVMGRSEAHNRYLRYQAMRIDQLNDRIDQLMSVRQTMQQGISIDTRITQLNNDIKTLQREMRAGLTALIDAEHNNDYETRAQVQAQLEQLEQDLTSTQQQLQELQRFTQREQEQQRTRKHPRR